MIDTVKNRKGLILAGGSGSRLYPLTLSISKQLLPLYDKPMIYYSISTLMLAGVRDILLISTPNDIPRFQSLLKDGSQWGLNIQYCIQPSPDGLAQAYILGESFVGNNLSVLVLGDNIFYGHDFYDLLKANYAITGLYFYDSNVVEMAKNIKPSKRGELEITELNKLYLQNKKLHVEIMGRGYAWLDTGTYQSLLEAGQFISTIEERQGLKIACPEEISYRNGWIDKDQLEDLIKPFKNNEYGNYLERVLRES